MLPTTTADFAFVFTINSTEKNIGEIKQSTGKEVLDSQREKEIIDRLALKAKILNKVSLHLIFKNIFKISRKIQS